MPATATMVLLIIIIIGFIVILFLVRSPEDSWIKDERGVWVKHGVPAETPDYVKAQQDTIQCSLDLYQIKKSQGIIFSSQCLGTCQDYAIDIVNVPRNAEDDKPENQCSDFREGKVGHFIELDKNGEIIRVA